MSVGDFITECPYKSRCTDNGSKCPSCVHEPKRSYYEPYYPYYPSYPYPQYPPPYPTVTFTTTFSPNTWYQYKGE
jgi:hypothetical protein